MNILEAPSVIACFDIVFEINGAGVIEKGMMYGISETKLAPKENATRAYRLKSGMPLICVWNRRIEFSRIEV